MIISKCLISTREWSYKKKHNYFKMLNFTTTMKLLKKNMIISKCLISTGEWSYKKKHNNLKMFYFTTTMKLFKKNYVYLKMLHSYKRNYKRKHDLLELNSKKRKACNYKKG